MPARPAAKASTSSKKPAPAAAAPAPASKAAVPSKVVDKSVAAKPTVNPPAAVKTKTAKAAPSAEERYRMVAEAAYFIAEKRGFAPGNHGADWAKAEAEIAAKLGG